MMRTGASRALLRPFTNPTTARARFVHNLAQRSVFGQNSIVGKKFEPLALTAFRGANTALVRSYASGAVPGTTQDLEKEKKLANALLDSSPQFVSDESTTYPVKSEDAAKQQEDDTDMMAGIRHDMKIIKDTFALDTVPQQAVNIGLAGVLPYLATSVGTVFCAFEVNTAHHNGGQGFLLSDRTAELCLHVLEPLQVGYGAVIISFLGAIHWGLEWAGYGGEQGYKRYAIGIVAPAVAWPTLLMPVEYALITQFLAFNLLYSVDSSATIRGWTPPWYSSYRFILTFIVGTSIVISLIGRGHISDRIGTSSNTAEHLKELTGDVKGAKKVKKAKASVDDE